MENNRLNEIREKVNNISRTILLISTILSTIIFFMIEINIYDKPNWIRFVISTSLCLILGFIPYILKIFKVSEMILSCTIVVISNILYLVVVFTYYYSPNAWSIGFIVVAYTVLFLDNKLLLFSSIFVLIINIIHMSLFYKAIFYTSIIVEIPARLFFISLFIVIVNLTSKTITQIIIDNHSKLIENEKLSKKLLRLDKLKDEFLSTTSHELKTPLTGIIGMAESLRENSDILNHKNVVGDIDLIISSGKRLLELINDILDFSKLKEKKLKIKKSSVDLWQIIEVVNSIVRKTSDLTNIEMIIEKPKDDIYLFGDENRIQQILYNIIGNALKFTDEGYIKIWFEIINDYVKFCVEDTGIGIPEDKYEIIFKYFEQADNSISREHSGAGIGLAVTKKLVELHNGEIWIESIVGKGSKFYFTLPLHKKDNLNNEIIKIAKNNKKIDLKIDKEIQDLEAIDKYLNEKENINSEIRILLVDDEKLNVYLIKKILSKENYYIDIAYNGIEALAKVEVNKYDLAILDIMMPKMSGYEVCKKIRLKYSLYDLPIIFLTTINNKKEINVGFELGANDYITKPFEKIELLSRVKTLISLKSAVESAIGSAKMFGDAKIKANTDYLTGVNNRRRILEIAENEIENLETTNDSLSLLILDIDDFKIINDKYGHDIGDEVIIEVVTAISDSVRLNDRIGRYGGEEFLVILPYTKIEHAYNISQRIINTVSKKIIRLKNGKEISCTISIGISSIFNNNKMTLSQLIKVADNNLYIAKKEGKNKVVIDKNIISL